MIAQPHNSVLYCAKEICHSSPETIFMFFQEVFFLLFHLHLHRDYAVAKECVTEEAKTGCAIGQYINRDLFNPFCTYNTDPALNTSSNTKFFHHL